MSERRERPRVVCVLGMHRSGTSAVTRAVVALGAYLGEEGELLAPAPDNPEGFWERRDVCALSGRILEALGTTWDTAAPLPDGWPAAPGLEPLRRELDALIGGVFGERPLWVWKDPRTCLLLPLWKQVLAARGVDLGVICATRNPLDVAKSLQKRDGIAPGRSFGIWFNYTLSALQALWDVPAVFVSYDRFLEDPRGELRRCAAALDLPWPAGAAALDAALASQVRPELRHSVSAEGDLRGAGAVGPVTQLQGLVQRLCAGASLSDPEIAAALARLGEEHAAHTALFRDELAQAGEARLALLEAEARLRDCRTQVRDQRALLDRIERSWSWRLTAPLRRLWDARRRG